MRFRALFALFMMLAIAAVSAHSQAAKPTRTQEKTLRSEVGATYTYMRGNAPPGGCGCFNMNGGGIAYAWQMKPGAFALVGDITVDHAGSIGAAGYTLTLSTFTFGGRYLPPVHSLHWQPFGEVLIGVAHSSGTLMQPPNAGAANAGAAFAANMGGGVDLHLKGRFALRVIQAEYLATTFNNAANNHQNNIRIDTGAILRF